MAFVFRVNTSMFAQSLAVLQDQAGSQISSFQGCAQIQVLFHKRLDTFWTRIAN